MGNHLASLYRVYQISFTSSDNTLMRVTHMQFSKDHIIIPTIQYIAGRCVQLKHGNN